MSENLYEDLRELLDTHPVGCPYAPAIIDILKILFTEKEAQVALGLGFRPFNIDEIARRSGIEPEEATNRLKSLADRGLVFTHKKKNEVRYALLNAIQIFENPYRKGVQDTTIKKLTPLWKEYNTKSLQSLGGTSTSLLRVVPIEKSIDARAEILTYENVYEMIDKARVVGISRCACRELEQNCNSPREGCMLFDTTCTYLVEHGFGRYLTKDEMKKKLREFDEMGLVRQVNNTSDRLEILCHCCSCCCRILSALKDYNNPRVLTRSAYIPVRDLEKCIGCGICADERCPVDAIQMDEEKPVVIIERCIGCGLCSTGCPQAAIRMERSVDIPEPPASYMDLGLRLLQEKGKMEKFIEVNTPQDNN